MTATAQQLQELRHELTTRKAYNSPFQLRAYRKLYKKLKHKLITTNNTTKPNQLKLL